MPKRNAQFARHILTDRPTQVCRSSVTQHPVFRDPATQSSVTQHPASRHPATRPSITQLTRPAITHPPGRPSHSSLRLPSRTHLVFRHPATWSSVTQPHGLSPPSRTAFHHPAARPFATQPHGLPSPSRTAFRHPAARPSITQPHGLSPPSRRWPVIPANRTFQRPKAHPIALFPRSWSWWNSSEMRLYSQALGGEPVSNAAARGRLEILDIGPFPLVIDSISRNQRSKP
jgi:hypothetical protein